jgi:Fe2+ transport system protein FeoA
LAFGFHTGASLRLGGLGPLGEIGRRAGHGDVHAHPERRGLAHDAVVGIPVGDRVAARVGRLALDLLAALADDVAPDQVDAHGVDAQRQHALKGRLLDLGPAVEEQVVVVHEGDLARVGGGRGRDRERDRGGAEEREQPTVSHLG